MYYRSTIVPIVSVPVIAPDTPCGIVRMTGLRLYLPLPVRTIDWAASKSNNNVYATFATKSSTKNVEIVAQLANPEDSIEKYTHISYTKSA